jgi:endonuclease/exonuclease/phosphatase family metal-dependent hydrolase
LVGICEKSKRKKENCITAPLKVEKQQRYGNAKKEKKVALQMSKFSFSMQHQQLGEPLWQNVVTPRGEQAQLLSEYIPRLRNRSGLFTQYNLMPGVVDSNSAKGRQSDVLDKFKGLPKELYAPQYGPGYSKYMSFNPRLAAAHTTDIVTETRNGPERATLHVAFLPKLPSGQFNFRPGVITREVYEQQTGRDWLALPEYQNPVYHLYAEQRAPEQLFSQPNQQMSEVKEYFNSNNNNINNNINNNSSINNINNSISNNNSNSKRNTNQTRMRPSPVSSSTKGTSLVNANTQTTNANYSGSKIATMLDNFTIVSWNIHNGFYNEDESEFTFAASVQWLKSVRPDILCLQEVTWRGITQTQFEAIMRQELGLVHFVYANAEDLYGNGFFGQVIVSRFPPVFSYALELPRGNVPEEGRSAAIMTVQPSPTKLPLTIVNTHLDVHDQTEETRYLQLQAIASFLNTNELEPAIIAGDMNATRRQDYTLQQWNRLGGDKYIPTVALNSLEQLYGSSSNGQFFDVLDTMSTQYTPNKANLSTLLARYKRIDYMFVVDPNGALRVDEAAIANQVRTSDHYPLVARITMLK